MDNEELSLELRNELELIRRNGELRQQTLDLQLKNEELEAHIEDLEQERQERIAKSKELSARMEDLRRQCDENRRILLGHFELQRSGGGDRVH